jgi:hypothetical protein
MVKRIERGWVLGFAMAVVFGAGCQVSKSANPLSPSVAGPIAGVNISKPNLLEPGPDWQILPRDQPVRLMFQNADSNSARALFYTLEVASDAEFKNIVFTRSRVEGGTGITTFQLPDALPAGRTYWWRVRAEDGANIGEYSKVQSFSAVAPVTLTAPAPVAPGGSITTLTPEFRVRAGNKTGPYERITYMLQVGNNTAFTSIAATFVVDEAGGETTIAQNYSFLNGRTYYWRVQARDTGDSRAVSPWSSTASFSVNVPLPPAPPPPGGGGGDDGPPPGGPTGDWNSCGSTPGKAIVECVRNAVYRRSTLENAFDVTKRVAWLLRGRGYGLLEKPGGENIITWKGESVSISRIAMPSGKIIKILSDAGPGGSNGAGWSECSDKNDLECYVEANRFIPAKQPEW